MSVRASIIICTRNRRQSLIKVLKTLQSVTMPPAECELLVIDNGSVDGTAEEATQNLPANFDSRVLIEPKRGQVYARNHGIREAKGEIIIFTDDDVHPNLDWLVQILSPYQSEEVSAVQG